MTYRRLSLVLSILVLLFLLCGGPILILLYVVERFNAVNLPPVDCLEERPEALYCEQAYFDDGLGQLSGAASQRPNCCVMERRILDSDFGGFRVLACDMDSKAPLNCANVEYFGLYDWQVDGRSLSADVDWDGHQSDILHGHKVHKGEVK